MYFICTRTVRMSVSHICFLVQRCDVRHVCCMNCIVVDEANRNPEALKKILYLDLPPERRLPRQKQTDSYAAQRWMRADGMLEQGQQQARH